ncbi:hypothetical protein M595_5204 [Lyngbya aestuarii BL J]|uniref:DarT domain-containing protein n=2 Tax=Lyngbya aestuarii TaxID=118322 RepID=U7QDM7_9CYAN|nr:hypothetical protein M595_5204 [Lyngbya aestuarii BL J]
MTHINNLASIIRNGLLSHNEAYRRGLIQVDISEPDVQDRRADRTVDNILLHEYVPLYFSPRNPMLYKRIQYQDDIVILGIDPQLLLEANVIFSDGNAAARETRFYRGVQMLNQLPWNVIWAKYWNDSEDGKRIKCAEILVYPTVAPNKIKAIFCRSEKHRNSIVAAKQKTDIIGRVNPDLYF